MKILYKQNPKKTKNPQKQLKKGDKEKAKPQRKREFRGRLSSSKDFSADQEQCKTARPRNRIKTSKSRIYREEIRTKNIKKPIEKAIIRKLGAYQGKKNANQKKEMGILREANSGNKKREIEELKEGSERERERLDSERAEEEGKRTLGPGKSPRRPQWRGEGNE